MDETAKAIEEQKAKLEQAEEERIRRVAEADKMFEQSSPGRPMVRIIDPAEKTKVPPAVPLDLDEIEARLKAGE